SEDLRAALESASGKDLKDFFASWIYGAGHPVYQLSWDWNRQTSNLRLTLKQLQREPAFPNALPIDILTSRGKRWIVLRPTSKQMTEEMKLDGPPTAVSIDPANTILKEAGVSQTVKRENGKLKG
ncbi:MAG TPA: hypothetical protein VGW76_14960, partial [Pyrinomonadaceae bacterium]|nr:hypothetical protein [Pyrinomonadaceae bacterium]